jgi:hypothetical protein
VVVHRHSEIAFGRFLSDDVAIQEGLDLLGSRQFIPHGLSGCFLGFLANDVITQIYALVADKYGGPGNELTDFVLALVAKGTMQDFSVDGTFFIGHKTLISIGQ